MIWCVYIVIYRYYLLFSLETILTKKAKEQKLNICWYKEFILAFLVSTCSRSLLSDTITLKRYSVIVAFSSGFHIFYNHLILLRTWPLWHLDRSRALILLKLIPVPSWFACSPCRPAAGRCRSREVTGWGKRSVVANHVSRQDAKQIVGAGVHLFISPFQDLDYAAGGRRMN